MNEYVEVVKKLLSDIQRANQKTIKQGAKLLTNRINKGGMLFVFGSGHSSLLVEEAFHRAGGMIPVVPIFADFISPRCSPKIAAGLERAHGVSKVLFSAAKVTKKDLMIVVSQSGINAASIEMVLECRKNKVSTIGITSITHSKNVESRHKSGKKLMDLCDIILDNQCPLGDALVDFDNGNRVAAGSTLAGVFLYNWLLAESCKIWKAKGKTLPIYKSVNTRGGTEHNERLEKHYRSRISGLL